MRISDWSSDVCSSDLGRRHVACGAHVAQQGHPILVRQAKVEDDGVVAGGGDGGTRFVDGADGIGGETGPFETAADQLAQAVFVLEDQNAHDECRSRKRSVRHVFDGRAILGLEAYRSEEPTSELQSLLRNSYAVLCLN